MRSCLDMKHPRQDEADALCMTVEELLEIERNRADEAEARVLGIEVWELHLRRAGARVAQIEARRAEYLKTKHEILHL